MSELVFVTGASGFLGSHIVVQLLQQGYRVRAAAREAKVPVLKSRYAKYGSQFEAVAINDIATDQFPEALKGVNAVIHTASPLGNRNTPEEMLRGAVEGTLNTVKQTYAAGITRIVVTSSIVTVINPNRTFTDQDWNPITREAALSGDSMVAYGASKTLAEQALWAFGEEHPELDITTLNPPFLYGPLSEGFEVPTLNYDALSTDMFIYQLLTPNGVFPSSPGYADVRDVAKAHIAALTSPPAAIVKRKRILFASPYGFDFKATIDLIAEKRFQLKDRLTKVHPPTFPYDRTPVDFDRIQLVLGLNKDDFKPFEDTIIDTVDSLMALEAVWVAQGASIPYHRNVPSISA